MEMVLTDKEKAAVLKEYGDEETAVRAYETWNPAEKLWGTTRRFSEKRPGLMEVFVLQGLSLLLGLLLFFLLFLQPAHLVEVHM